MRSCLWALAISWLVQTSVALARGLQISGGLDGRVIRSDDSSKGTLKGAFLNARHVIQDNRGDRWILVGQIDADDGFEEIRPYQTYVQYKGPLGRWNLRAGHYILPFGLLSDYDTERLLLQTQELTSLGIKLDTGVEALGFFGSWDYAVSLSQGVGRNRLSDVDDNKLLTGRLGFSVDELRVGLSGLSGDVRLDKEISTARIIREENRLGIDATQVWGPLTARGELAFGSNDGRDVNGGFLGADYSLTSRWEANFKYARWDEGNDTDWIGAGFTCRWRPGIILRIADEQKLGKSDENVLSAQLYYEFSKTIF